MRKRLTREKWWAAFPPLLLNGAAQAFAYYAPLLLPPLRESASLAIPLDARIPFLPVFILPYMAAFLQWLWYWFFLAVQGGQTLKRFLRAEMAGKLFCFAVFMLLPTAIERPEIVGTDVFSRLTQYIFSADPASRLFPSFHCFLAWMGYRAFSTAEELKRYRPLALVFTLLLCASTVFVKQHYLIDIPAGILVAELAVRLFVDRPAKREIQA